MKKLTRPAITIGLSLLLALCSAALTYSAPSTSTQAIISATTFLAQVTPTAQVEDKSEIGSTDEIVIMGGVIAFIIIIPIFLSRKSWR
jgi:hypothetical protein